jgi:hypothetical protein
VKPLLLLATCAGLFVANVALAQTTTGNPPPPSPDCQGGQVLQANGQPCSPKLPGPAPVPSTGAIGQFPTDLLPPPSTATSSGANCQPGQAITAGGQPCN